MSEGVLVVNDFFDGMGLGLFKADILGCANIPNYYLCGDEFAIFGPVEEVIIDNRWSECALILSGDKIPENSSQIFYSGHLKPILKEEYNLLGKNKPSDSELEEMVKGIIALVAILNGFRKWLLGYLLEKCGYIIQLGEYENDKLSLRELGLV